MIESTQQRGHPQRTLTLCGWGIEGIEALTARRNEHEALRVHWLAVAGTAVLFVAVQRIRLSVAAFRAEP